MFGEDFRVTRDPIRQTIRPSAVLGPFHSRKRGRRDVEASVPVLSPLEASSAGPFFSHDLRKSKVVPRYGDPRTVGIRDSEVKERATRFPT